MTDAPSIPRKELEAPDGGPLEVCPADEFPSGGRLLLSLPGREIGIFDVDGDYYALENRCAHQGGPVCAGKRQGSLEGEFLGSGRRVQEYFDDGVPAIACPWHGWEYDVTTGDHLGDSEFSLRTYPVTVEDDTIYLDV